MNLHDLILELRAKLYDCHVLMNKIEIEKQKLPTTPKGKIYTKSQSLYVMEKTNKNGTNKHRRRLAKERSQTNRTKQI